MSDAPTFDSIPWRRDPRGLGARLERWFDHVLPAGSAPSVGEITMPEGTGMSSETMLFDVELREHGARQTRRYVARLAPDPASYPVFPAYDLELQQRCLRTVRAHTDVPVPEAPWYEADPRWLGSPFLVMGRVDGVAATDMPPYVFGGWIFDATAEDRRRIERNVVSVLARLHQLRPDHIDQPGDDRSPVDLTFLDRPGHGASPLDQHLGYQRSYYEWAREGLRVPLIERTFAWLDEHRPPDDFPTVLNWGDARIANILWRDHLPVAVLDWEMAALGPPEVDIAWSIHLHDFFQGIALNYGFPGIPDFLDRSRVAAIYEELTGYQPRHLRWFEVFALVRFQIITVRTTMRSIEYGMAPRPDDPDDLITFRAMAERILEGSDDH
jgi:aminoglycoside phosphotransferase (APT) family kinase protein